MRARTLQAALLVLALGSLAGCVERRLTFTLEGGARDVPVRIELDGEPIGTLSDAPLTVTFARYGTREWVARADGYETASGRVDLSPPWYQYPPMDFVAEVLVPARIVDQHDVRVTLTPMKTRQPGPVNERAEEYRRQADRELKPREEPKPAAK